MDLLSKNISANLLSNLWLAFLLLLVTPIYIYYLGVESYALVGFYISWLAILGILDTGVSATAMREIAWLEARPQERNKIPILLKTLEVVYWSIILILGAAIFSGAGFFWGRLVSVERFKVRHSARNNDVDGAVSRGSITVRALFRWFDGIAKASGVFRAISFFWNFKGLGSDCCVRFDRC